MTWNPNTPGSTSQADNQYAVASNDLDAGLAAGKGLVLVAPNGTRYRLSVSNAGAAVWTAL